MINTLDNVISYYIYIPPDGCLLHDSRKMATADIKRYFKFLYNPRHFFFAVRREGSIKYGK